MIVIPAAGGWGGTMIELSPGQFGMAAAADNLSQLLPARLDPTRVRQMSDHISATLM